MPKPPSRTKFLVELIKPSHYDDDGYIIHWRRGFVPSNSLSTLYAIAQDCSQRRILGDDVDIQVEVTDESNSVVRMKRIVRRFIRNDYRGIVCLVGVQTNQFARALDIARQLRSAGIQVVIGGFHVSGCVSMLPELTAELKEALALGVTLFAGEAEGRLDEVLRAAFGRRLQPLYNFVKQLPQLENQAAPFLPRRYIRRYAGMMGCFDAGRGCPFSCSFCTIINVQGRKSRFRMVDDVEALIRANYAQGVRSMFITDDDFARNKCWEQIFDRIIDLREKHGFRITLMLQADALASVPSVQAQTASQTADAMTSTRALVERALVILRDPRLSLTDKRRELRQVAEQRFDFPDMARAAMNPHWNGLSPISAGPNVKGFTAFIEDAYLNKIQDYSGQDIQFIKETSDGPGGAVVYTSVVKSADEPIALNFRLRQQNGQWKIYDLVIDDISIIRSYRAQFARVLDDKGFDTLITVLMQKQQELDALLGKQSAN